MNVPYGAWPSPISAEQLVEGATTVGEIRADGVDIWWTEARPDEGGRTQLVRRTPDGQVDDLFGPWDADSPGGSWNARTAVHEYGGGAWTVRQGVVLFANWSDQRIYRTAFGTDPVAVTPAPAADRGWRWSEPAWIDGTWIICVRESHEPDVIAAHGEAMNELVALPADGSAVDDPGLVRVLVSGPDFVHSPAVHGDRLAWLEWSHPNMPWDSTALCVAELSRDGDGAPIGGAGRTVVAGSEEESIVQPGWLVGGELLFCSDRSGWWNPCVGWGDGIGAAIAGGVDAEIGGPLWVGGLRWWAELDDGRIACRVTKDGASSVAVIDDGALALLDTPFTDVSQVVAGADGTALVIAASPTTEPGAYRLSIPADGAGAPTIERLSPERGGIDASWISVPRHITFDSAGGRSAHALHYPPTNPDVVAPQGEAPPLLVMIHGGPSSAARHRLDLEKQFWTSRGFAVVDVNYGGSTGYGRAYRELLDGTWGIVDVEDAVAAAAHLGSTGDADPARLAIRGGSAGGYTTLAALCFHHTFAAGASYYGVADLAALAADTHKFESRYLDRLVGPWPQAKDVYDQRSPINHTDGFDRPLIVFQGSEDEVVPPNQAEMIVAALEAKSVPHAYVLFEAEQHGFRRADTIVTAQLSELWFYGKVFGFEPADELPDVPGAVGL